MKNLLHKWWFWGLGAFIALPVLIGLVWGRMLLVLLFLRPARCYLLRVILWFISLFSISDGLTVKRT